MKIRSFLAAAIAVCAALSAQADANPIFTEEFATATGKWSASGGAVYDNQGWTASGSVYKGEGGIRIGTSSAAATLTSPLIPISNSGVDTAISIAVQAAGYSGKNGGLSLKAIDENGADIPGASWTKTLKSHTSTDAVALDDSDSELWFTDMSFSTTASFKLVFTTSLSSPKDALRVLLGYIQVSEEISSSGGDDPSEMDTLDTPTNLASSSVTDSGFSLTWDGVENALGYEVDVSHDEFDNCGTVVVSGTTATVTGLDSDTTYTVRVRALASTDLLESQPEYYDSEWSESTTVTTSLAGGMSRTTLFEENFTDLDNAWTGNSYLADDEGTFSVDEADWTGMKITRRRSCAAVGLSTTYGYAQTRAITLTNNATSAAADVSFYAVTPTATANRKVVTVHVFAIDAETGSTNWHAFVEAPKLSSTSVTDITTEGAFLSATVENLPERFFLRFEPDPDINEKQFAIDAVKVTQTYNSTLSALPAPVATLGDATITSLAFSWGTVAGAMGYAVELRDGSGARVAYDASVTGTATTFTDLNWNSDYTIRVKALGDDSSSCNSPWSEGVVGHTLENVLAPEWSATAGAGDAVMAVVSNKTFSVSAERGGEPLEVAFGDLSPAAADATPTFSSGTFSWTPAAGDEGKTFTATFTTDAGEFSTNIVFNVLARPALVEPVISVREISFNSALAEWDSPCQIRASRYTYRLWSGSDTASDSDTDCEHFHDRVVPGGWTLSGTIWQTSSGYNATPVAMTHEGDYVVSKLYDAPVTTLSFRLRRTGKADTPVVKFYASTGADRESVWNEVSIGEQDADYTNTDYSLEFSQSSNYRRFKWVYYEKHSNVNLGSIVAKYEGAGAKFKAGSASALVDAPSDNVLNLTGLRPETNYFLEVRVEDENGTEKSSTVRFSTLVAPKYTLMVLK